MFEVSNWDHKGLVNLSGLRSNSFQGSSYHCTRVSLGSDQYDSGAMMSHAYQRMLLFLAMAVASLSSRGTIRGCPNGVETRGDERR